MKALFFGIVTIVLLVVDYLGFYVCTTYRCRLASDGVLLHTIILSGISFLFAGILSFLPERISKSWWKFARIAIPVIFVISTLINLQLHHSPSGGVMDLDEIFDLPALVFMYIVFIVGSCVQIWRGYRKGSS